MWGPSLREMSGMRWKVNCDTNAETEQPGGDGFEEPTERRTPRGGGEGPRALCLRATFVSVPVRRGTGRSTAHRRGATCADHAGLQDRGIPSNRESNPRPPSRSAAHLSELGV